MWALVFFVPVVLIGAVSAIGPNRYPDDLFPHATDPPFAVFAVLHNLKSCACPSEFIMVL